MEYFNEDGNFYCFVMPAEIAKITDSLPAAVKFYQYSPYPDAEDDEYREHHAWQLKELGRQPGADSAGLEQIFAGDHTLFAGDCREPENYGPNDNLAANNGLVRIRTHGFDEPSGKLPMTSVFLDETEAQAFRRLRQEVTAQTLLTRERVMRLGDLDQLKIILERKIGELASSATTPVARSTMEDAASLRSQIARIQIANMVTDHIRTGIAVAEGALFEDGRQSDDIVVSAAVAQRLLAGGAPSLTLRIDHPNAPGTLEFRPARRT